MSSPFWIILNTKKGVKLLSKEFEGDLYTRGTLIYILFGALLYVFFVSEITATWGSSVNGLLLFVTPGLVLIYGTLISKLVFYIGRLLGSSARYFEVYTLLAYSMIPITIGIVLLVALTKIPLLEPSLNTEFNRNVLIFTSIFVSFKIILLSLWRLGKYYLILTVFNIIPTLILPMYLLVEVFHIFEWNDLMIIVHQVESYFPVIHEAVLNLLA